MSITPADCATQLLQQMANMHRWKSSALAAAALALGGLYAADASALALGRITVQSALGEPLRAEIDMPQISASEAETLRTQVAPRFEVSKTEDELRGDFDRVTSKLAERLGPPAHAPRQPRSVQEIEASSIDATDLLELDIPPLQWIVPDLLQLSIDRVDFSDIGGVPTIGVRDASIQGWNAFMKLLADWREKGDLDGLELTSG